MAATLIDDAELMEQAQRLIENPPLRNGPPPPGASTNNRQSQPERRWPELAPEARYGLVGEIVDAIEPHTEGDPVAILVNTIAMYGSAVGRSPHVRVGATRHGTNEFFVLVGKTSRARKGTAHDEAFRLLSQADAGWTERVAGGISSGEGLIHAVRDATFRLNKDGESVPDDAGVTDKRLMIVEPEYASVLKVGRRDGNTVTEVLRRGWDGNDLRVMTRKDPLVATRPHLSLVGHITEDELHRTLDDTSQTNGYFNRNAIACVRRSKLLPHGGSLPDSDVAHLARRLQRSMDLARRRGEMRRTPAANELWAVAYQELTRERPGMFGAITARAEAHALRFSLLYALLDGAGAIDVPHLEAALTLWEYCEDSSRYLFGDAVGDPVADKVLNALRRSPTGMTQNAIGELFSKHVRSADLASALERLLADGMVQSETRRETGGRPATIWMATP